MLRYLKEMFDRNVPPKARTDLIFSAFRAPSEYAAPGSSEGDGVDG